MILLDIMMHSMLARFQHSGGTHCLCLQGGRMYILCNMNWQENYCDEWMEKY